MSNLRDEMSRFVIGVDDLVKVECCTAMLHDHMIVSRVMVYYQSIEDSKLYRIGRNLNRSGSSDQSQPRFIKRDQTQDGPSSPLVKLEKVSGSQDAKTTCATC